MFWRESEAQSVAKQEKTRHGWPNASPSNDLFVHVCLEIPYHLQVVEVGSAPPQSFARMCTGYWLKQKLGKNYVAAHFRSNHT
eukprot:1635445-Pleurochrysis_carterae.AAC.1